MHAADDLDPDAQAHSGRLADLIREQIAGNGGVLPFWRFMELALYAPGLGYYSAGATKLGPGGDFVTAPELGGLFAECVADALSPPLRTLGDDEYGWLTMRARGGSAMTMTCAAHVQASGQGFPGQLGVWSDKHVPALARLAQGIHDGGSVSMEDCAALIPTLTIPPKKCNTLK